VPADKLSAKEAALIAQARAQLAKAQAPATTQVARVKRTLAASPAEDLAAGAAASAPVPTPAERVAALMAEARAESARERERRRRLYLYIPLAFISVVGMWALLWMWQRL
jgi:hypothetical protein